jgi:hypothetical protein
LKLFTLETYPIISMSQPSTPSNSMQGAEANVQSPSAPIMENVLPTMTTGSNESSPTSSNSGTPSTVLKENGSGTPLPNLSSNVKPQEIQSRVHVVPRVLRVTNHDVAALSQLITEFKEQFSEYQA